MATQTRVGGLSEAKEADENIQQLCNQVKEKAEEITGLNYGTFVAVEYKTQVVAGTNYFVKVKVGHDDYIELRIFVSLGRDVSLSAVKQHLNADSEIEYIP